MNKRTEEKINLRQPKIYNPPRDQNVEVFPKVLVIIILVLIVLIALIYLLIFSPIFKIKTIEIKGNLSPDATSYLDQYKGQNLFVVKSQTISKKLQDKNPEYLSINVYKGIPNILRVEINERRSALVWETQSRDYFVDNDGVAYKMITPEEINDLTTIIDNKNIGINLPNQVATSNFINFVNDAKIKIKESGIAVKNFQVNETIFQVDALTQNGFKIIFDTTRPLSDQMDAFTLVYNDHKNEITQYIDTRVEGKVYYQ